MQQQQLKAECWCRMRKCPQGSITEPPQVLSAFISCLLEQTLLLRPRCGCCIVWNLREKPFSPLRSLMITWKSFLRTRRRCRVLLCGLLIQQGGSRQPPLRLPAGSVFLLFTPEQLTRRPGVGMSRQGGGWSGVTDFSSASPASICSFLSGVEF